MPNSLTCRTLAAGLLSALAVVPAHAWTMTSALTQITVPEACVPTDPNRRQGEPAVCAELRREGGMRFVGIEEMLAGPVDGRLPTRANWSDITMNIFFNAWAQGVVRGSRGGKVTAAVVPSARLPRGIPHCKSFTIEREDPGTRMRDRGLYCAIWPSDASTPILLIAHVTANIEPSKGHSIPQDFDRMAGEILSTFRLR
jgi:hypothetical protein